MRVIDAMKNNTAITISALCVSLYGLAGLWINLGNETIAPVLFASFIAAIVIALILIVISAYILSKEQERKNTIKYGVKCLILSVICFAVFAVLSANSDHIDNNEVYSLSTAVLIAFGTASFVYSVLFMIFAVFRKHK